MAILKAKKAKELSEKEMEEKMREFRLELSKERASSEIGGSVKNPGRIREVRRAIARIQTEKARRDTVKEKVKKNASKTEVVN